MGRGPGILTRPGICSLVSSVLGLIVMIIYRAALKSRTGTTDNWTGAQERWTDLGLMVVGTVFGLPAVSMTHSLAYVGGHEDTAGDAVRVFVSGAMQLCSSAMILTVGDRGAADQGRAAGIIMGVLLLIVAICQMYHTYVIYRSFSPGPRSSTYSPAMHYGKADASNGRNRADREDYDTNRTEIPLVSQAPTDNGAAAKA